MSRTLRNRLPLIAAALFACTAFAYTGGDPLGGGAGGTVATPTPTATPPADGIGTDTGSTKDQLQQLVDAYEQASNDVLTQTNATTSALVAQATANAQVTAAQAAVATATAAKEQALASLKGYIDSLDADGNPPRAAPAMPAPASTDTSGTAGVAVPPSAGSGTSTGSGATGGTADQTGATAVANPPVTA